MRLFLGLGMILSAPFFYCSVYASDIVSNSDQIKAIPTSSPSLLTLACPISEQQYYQSKVVILASGSKQYDYGLSTAHGIINDDIANPKTCYLKRADGQIVELLDVHYSSRRKGTRSSADWVVLKLEKVNQTRLTRYNLINFSDLDPEQARDFTLDVTFPKAIGLGYNNQQCAILSAEAIGMKDENIRAHTCRVMPGQSGSPVSTTIENVSVLLGIHLGKAFVYRSPISGKAENLGYFRVIDSRMIAEIQNVVTRWEE